MTLHIHLAGREHGSDLNFVLSGDYVVFLGPNQSLDKVKCSQRG